MNFLDTLKNKYREGLDASVEAEELRNIVREAIRCGRRTVELPQNLRTDLFRRWCAKHGVQSTGRVVHGWDQPENNMTLLPEYEGEGVACYAFVEPWLEAASDGRLLRQLQESATLQEKTHTAYVPSQDVTFVAYALRAQGLTVEWDGQDLRPETEMVISGWT